jgi:hypothetical protein
MHCRPLAAEGNRSDALIGLRKWIRPFGVSGLKPLKNKQRLACLSATNGLVWRLHRADETLPQSGQVVVEAI